MRNLLLIGGAAALIALPAVALADSEGLRDDDPAAPAAAGVPTTDHALHAGGRGALRYDGSGGVVLEGRAIVRVRDLSSGKDLKATPSGFGETKVSSDGRVSRYAGTGKLSLDGSSYRLTIAGRFTGDVDPTSSNAATGAAWVAGRGVTILKGGVPWFFRAGQRILLTTGPMAVDLGDRRVHPARHDPKGPKGSKRPHHRGDRGPGATWRINGPASGTVKVATITGRIRVWDRSAAKDLAATVPAGTTTTTLGDGSVVYSGLRGAAVTLAGTAFRMKARASDLEGVFTPTAGTLALAFVQGRGTFDAGSATDVRAGHHGGVRVLLQAVAT
jgi:hypothetical protein